VTPLLLIRVLLTCDFCHENLMLNINLTSSIARKVRRKQNNMSRFSHNKIRNWLRHMKDNNNSAISKVRGKQDVSNQKPDVSDRGITFLISGLCNLTSGCWPLETYRREITQSELVQLKLNIGASVTKASGGGFRRADYPKRNTSWRRLSLPPPKKKSEHPTYRSGSLGIDKQAC
jgi:hypothetical protein